jgi:hypothetical protein
MMTNGAPIRYLMAAAARPRDRYSHRLAKSFSANTRSTSENDRASGTPFGDVPGRREAVCRRHSICGGAARRSGFSGAVDEIEHIEHALAAFDLRYDRCHRSHEVASRSMEGGIAAMPVNLFEHAGRALTQFTRCAVTADARRQFEHLG